MLAILKLNLDTAYGHQLTLVGHLLNVERWGLLTGVIKRKTFEEIVNGKNEDSSSAIMAHDPEEKMSIQSLENMITYFLQTEEYEKCAEIRDIIKVQDECTKES